jgi:hypothetical protein
MGPISVTAEAGLDIIRKLASGELEVHGILLRDTDGKKFRYILRGFENLPTDGNQLVDLPPLQGLHAAMSMTQLLQVISIAQNVAVAASLRRIEASLSRIEGRLSEIERRLARIETNQKLVLDALRSMQVSLLKPAKTAAMVALQHGNKTALITAGNNAQQAFHALLEQARHLVRTEEGGMPVALRLPTELADLAESAADAAYVASAIWLALDNQEAAAAVMREGADGIQSMRGKIGRVLTDPELLLRRLHIDEGRDTQVQEAGRRLEAAAHRSIGRAVMIEQGLIISDREKLSLERLDPVEGLAFVPLLAADEDAAE